MSVDKPKGFNRKSYEIPDCPICLEELVSDLSCAPCGHVFHSLCIYQSIQANSQCPCCRQRMTQGSLFQLRFTLKCNSEAEEQIQAFYNSLANDEKQNVIEIMNKYESQTREFTIVKKHRDELVSTCREQVDRLDKLEKREKEQTSNIKALKIKSESFEQKSHLQAQKIKDYEGLKLQDQQRLEELKKTLSELRSIQVIITYFILKEKMDSGRSNEDKYIEDIRRNKNSEEQAQRFYEMILMKKGAYDELARENEILRSQLQEQKASIDIGQQKLRQKEATIDELRKLNENQAVRIRLNKEKIDSLKKQNEDLQHRQSAVIAEKKQQQQPTTAACIAEVREEKHHGTTAAASIHAHTDEPPFISNDIFRDESSNHYSNKSIGFAAISSSTLSSNAQESLKQTKSINSTATSSLTSSVDQQRQGFLHKSISQQQRMQSINSNDSVGEINAQKQRDLHKRIIDSAAPNNNNNNINNNVQFLKKSKIDQPPSTSGSLFFEQLKKSSSSSAQTPTTSSAPAGNQITGGLGLFGLNTSKNSLLNKQQLPERSSLPVGQTKNVNSIANFFKQGK